LGCGAQTGERMVQGTTFTSRGVQTGLETGGGGQKRAKVILSLSRKKRNEPTFDPGGWRNRANHGDKKIGDALWGGRLNPQDSRPGGGVSPGF